MKVEKTSKRDKTFEPVSFEITFESLEEVKTFRRKLTGHGGVGATYPLFVALGGVLEEYSE